VESLQDDGTGAVSTGPWRRQGDDVCAPSQDTRNESHALHGMNCRTSASILKRVRGLAHWEPDQSLHARVVFLELSWVPQTVPAAPNLSATMEAWGLMRPCIRDRGLN
jgi:hypothetical protein